MSKKKTNKPYSTFNEEDMIMLNTLIFYMREVMQLHVKTMDERKWLNIYVGIDKLENTIYENAEYLGLENTARMIYASEKQQKD